MSVRHATARVRADAPLLLLLTLLSAAFATPVSAGLGPIGFTAFGGWTTDHHDRLVGAGLRAGVGPIAVVPNAEYVFADGARRYTLNLDATWSILPLGVASAWVGGGMARHVSDPDAGPVVRRSRVNVLAGAGLNAVPLKPFAQFKVTLMSGDHPAEIVIGARF